MADRVNEFLKLIGKAPKEEPEPIVSSPAVDRFRSYIRGENPEFNAYLAEDQKYTRAANDFRLSELDRKEYNSFIKQQNSLYDRSQTIGKTYSPLIQKGASSYVDPLDYVKALHAFGVSQNQVEEQQARTIGLKGNRFYDKDSSVKFGSDLSNIGKYYEGLIKEGEAQQEKYAPYKSGTDYYGQLMSQAPTPAGPYNQSIWGKPEEKTETPAGSPYSPSYFNSIKGTPESLDATLDTEYWKRDQEGKPASIQLPAGARSAAAAGTTDIGYAPVEKKSGDAWMNYYQAHKDRAEPSPMELASPNKFAAFMKTSKENVAKYGNPKYALPYMGETDLREALQLERSAVGGGDNKITRALDDWYSVNYLSGALERIGRLNEKASKYESTVPQLRDDIARLNAQYMEYAGAGELELADAAFREAQAKQAQLEDAEIELDLISGEKEYFRLHSKELEKAAVWADVLKDPSFDFGKASYEPAKSVYAALGISPNAQLYYPEIEKMAKDLPESERKRALSAAAYEYINGTSVNADIDPFGWEMLSPDEKLIFNTLHNRSEYDKALKFLDDFDEVFLFRRQAANVKEWENYAKENPVWAWLNAGGQNLVNAVMTPFQLLSDSPYSPMFDPGVAGQTIQATQSKIAGENLSVSVLGKPLGSLIYDMLSTMRDVGASIGLGVLAGSRGLTQFIMSSNTTSSTYRNALLSGTDRTTAAILSIGAGAIEWVTEKYSIEALMSDPQSALSYFFKNFFAEGTEEGASAFANLVMDNFFRGRAGDYGQSWKKIKEENPTWTNARITEAANAQWRQDLGIQVGQGSLMGGMLAAPGTATAAIDSFNAQPDILSKSIMNDAGMGLKPGEANYIEAAGWFNRMAGVPPVTVDDKGLVDTRPELEKNKESTITEAIAIAGEISPEFQKEIQKDLRGELTQEKLVSAAAKISEAMSKGETRAEETMIAPQTPAVPGQDNRGSSERYTFDTQVPAVRQALTEGVENGTVSEKDVSDFDKLVKMAQEEAETDGFKENGRFYLSLMSKLKAVADKLRAAGIKLAPVRPPSITDRADTAIEGMKDLSAELDESKAAVDALQKQIDEWKAKQAAPVEMPADVTAENWDEYRKQQEADIQAEYDANMAAAQERYNQAAQRKAESTMVDPAVEKEAAKPQDIVKPVDPALTERFTAFYEGQVKPLVTEMGKPAAEPQGITEPEDPAITEAQPTQPFIETAREYGYAGLRMADMIRMVGENNVTEQMRTAFEQGIAQAKEDAKQRGGGITAAGPQTGRRGYVRSITPEDAQKYKVEMIGRMDAKIRAISVALRGLADSTGINFVLYDSPINDQGEHTGKQGWYDPKTATAFLDINAGYDGNTPAVMNAAGHEITHFIEQYSPEYYNNTYKPAIIDALYEGDENALLELVEEQKRIAKADGRTITERQAMSEVIADASERMLFGDQALLNKLAADHPSLFVRIKNWLDTFIKKLQKAFALTKADSSAAKLLEQTVNQFSQAQEKWWNALEQSAIALRGEDQAPPAGPTQQERLAAYRASRPAPVQEARQAPAEEIPDFNAMFAGAVNAEAVQDMPQELVDILLSLPDANKLAEDGREAVKGSKPAKPIQTGAAPIDALKGFPVQFRNLFKKWAENEWVNVNVAAPGDVGGTNFANYAIKWYNAGREGIRTIDVAFDDNELKFPPFMQDVFYNQGKADAEAGRAIKTETKKPREAKPAEPLKAAPAPAKIADTPSQNLANKIASISLRPRVPLTSAQLFKLADEAFGGTQGEGKYSVKDAYDALELAVNQYLLKRMALPMMNTDSAANTDLALKEILSILELLPTQTKRTAEMESFQQFSTPPNIAYLAAWAANISENDFILEPSAGIGGLAVFAKAWGAEVAVNELSKRRLEVLRSMQFDHIFNENAEQIHNILPGNIAPTVVLMNPPFSATAGRTATNRTSNAIRHIEQALLRLQPNGRLVAIVGQGMADNSPSFKTWWDELRKKYNIRANIGIDGKNFSKYGTNFGIQLVVIDKTGPQTGITITSQVSDLSTLPKVLEGIRNDRHSIDGKTGQHTVKPGSTETAKGPGIRQDAPGAVYDGNDGRKLPGTQSDAVLEVYDAEGDGAPGELHGTGTQAQVESVDSKPKPAPGRKQGNDSQTAGSSAETGQGPSVRVSDGQPDQQLRSGTEQPRTAVTQPSASKDDGVYASYNPPTIKLKSSPHPAVLVESSAMASVQMPPATYVPKLPANVLPNLSQEQLISVTYAGQAFEKKLPNGDRMGFFIGDGTGVGKGREISGIIADSFAHGQKKAVWVSKTKDLMEDAIRDWTETTGEENAKDIISINKIKAQDAIKQESGIVFVSFDTVASNSRADPTVTRLKQIKDWLGPDFEGVIAFDEAHNMGNLLGKDSGRSKGTGADKAIAGVELQRAFPQGRMLYVTATAAQEVSELAFAERLGLWGDGTAFVDVRNFVDSINAAGLAAMELVSRDLKERGLYVSRSISYDGVEYQTVQHDLDDMQTEIYNGMSRAWQKVMENVDQMLTDTNANKNWRARGAAKSAFYGAVQRFYNQLLTSMSMPSVITAIEADLANNKSVVIQIVNTNEAEQERQLGKIAREGGDLDDMDLTPRGQLIAYLMKSFPVQQYEEYTDDKGNKLSRPVVDSEGNPVLNKEAVAARDALIAEVNQMSVPDGPVEMLFDAFGTENVAEVTGRGRRVVPVKKADGTIEKVIQKRPPTAGSADAQAFQNGEKRILIFSDAGGTGKSYHASKAAKNAQQRIHYVLQPGWIAKNAVQGFGRTHRSNQWSAPVYKLVTTNIKGHKRFISTIARRLDQLGALSKGQRQTGSGLFSSADNLESREAIEALRSMYAWLGEGRLDGLEPRTIFNKLGLYAKFYDSHGNFKLDETLARNMSTFLNRILALEVHDQNKLFEYYERIYESIYSAALEAGTLDQGLETIKADKVEIETDELVKAHQTGGATRYVRAKVSTKAKLLRTISDAQAYRSGFQGIYKTDSDEVKAVFRMADKTDRWGRVRQQYKLMSPDIGGKHSTWNEETLANRAVLMDKQEWTAAWKETVAQMPQYNEATMHLLTGSLLPIWDRMPQEGGIRAVRITADDGNSYLGRVIPSDKIAGVLNSMGYGMKEKTYTIDEVWDAVLKNNQQAQMAQGLRLVRSRVNNENRMELKGPNLWYLQRNHPIIFMEKIAHTDRFFMPVTDEGKKALSNILYKYPVKAIGSVDADNDFQYSMRRIASDNFLTERETDPGRLEDRSLLLEQLDARLYSDRDPSRIGVREKLVQAFESVGVNEVDKRTIEAYRAKIGDIEKDVQSLRETNAKIKELSFASGPRDMTELQRLKNNKQTYVNRIARHDSKLARLETAGPLADLIALEKKKAKVALKQQQSQLVAEAREELQAKVTEAKEKGKEKLAKYKTNQASSQYRGKIIETVDGMIEKVTNPSKNGYYPEVLKRPLGEFLKSINQQSKRSLKGGDNTLADKDFYERLNKLQTVLSRIKTSQQSEEAVSQEYAELVGFVDLPAGFTDRLAEMAELVERHIKAGTQEYVLNLMSEEQLKALYKMLKALDKALDNINDFHIASIFKHIDEAGTSTIQYADSMKSKLHREGKIDKFLNWDNTLPVYAFDRFGPAGKATFGGFAKGMDKQSKLAQEVVEFAKSAFTENEAREWGNQLLTITLNGNQVQVTAAHLMELYALNRREQAQGHLFGAGLRIRTFKIGNKNYAHRGNVTLPSEINAAFSQLTPRQVEVAKKLQHFMSTRGAELIDQVNMARFGAKQLDDENDTYWPIKSVPQNIDMKAEAPEGNPLFRVLNMSFMKPLTPKANNQIIISNIFDSFASHMAEVIQLNAFALPVLDAIKWFNYRQSYKDPTTGQKYVSSVRDSIRSAFGDAGESYITRMLLDLNGARMTGGGEEAAMTMLRHYNRSVVAANLRVALLQPTSIIRAHNVINARYLTGGILKNIAHLRRNIREMERESGIAGWKQLGFYDVNISRSLQDIIKRDNPLFDRLTEKTMAFPQAMDRITWAAIWEGAKNQVAAQNPNMNKDSQAYFDKVRDLFDQAIYRTQVVDTMLTRSEFMRRPTFVPKWTSSFMSEPTMTYNILAGQVHAFNDDIARGMSKGQAWSKNGRRIARTATTYALSSILVTMVEGLAGAWRDDDEYMTFMQKFAKAFSTNLLDNFMPLNLPIINDLWQLAKRFTGQIFNIDLWGYQDASPITAGAELLVSGVTALVSKLNDSSKSITEYGVGYKLLQGISALSGHPFAAMTREVVDLWNNTVGTMYGEYKVTRYKPAQATGYDALFEAIMSEDEEKMPEIRAILDRQGIDEKKVYTYGVLPRAKEAYKTGELTFDKAFEILEAEEGGPEKTTYWTVKKWEAQKAANDWDGDFKYSKFDGFMEAILTGENLKPLLKELTDHPEGDPKNTNSSIASAITEHFKDEYIKANNRERSNLKSRLLNAYVLLGYKREDRSRAIDAWLKP